MILSSDAITTLRLLEERFTADVQTDIESCSNGGTGKLEDVTDPEDCARISADLDLLREAGKIITALATRVASTELSARATARLAELEADVKRLSTPEWFYDADDPEYSYSDLADVADNMDSDGVMRMAGAREVCKLWVAMRVLTVDEDGNADDTEVAEFATEPEAAASWETSLAAAREAAASQRAAAIRHGVG
jgi:hypothetical protein